MSGPGPTSDGTPDGTPRALLPIATAVLAWVEKERPFTDPDDLRRIELCALAAREVALFHTLYPVPTGHICHGDCHHEGDPAP